MTDVDDKIIKRARVNRLLADYVARREGEADSAAALSAVRKEALRTPKSSPSPWP